MNRIILWTVVHLHLRFHVCQAADEYDSQSEAILEFTEHLSIFVHILSAAYNEVFEHLCID